MTVLLIDGVGNVREWNITRFVPTLLVLIPRPYCVTINTLPDFSRPPVARFDYSPEPSYPPVYRFAGVE